MTDLPNTAGAPATAPADGPDREDARPPAIPDVLPVLPLRQTVVFPSVIAPIAVGQSRSLRLIDDAMGANRLLALVATRRPELEEPGPDDLERVGTAARILQLMRLPDGSVRLLIQGLQRIRLGDFTSTEPYLIARVSEDAPRRMPDVDVEGLRRAVIDLLRRLAPLMEELPDELPMAAERLSDPLEVAYLAASVIPIGMEAQQELLELDPLDAKLRRLIELLQKELAARELGRSISEQTRERIGKANREALLREQLRSIQAELGEGEGGGEVADLRRRIEEAKLPDEARREAERELDRFAAIPEASPERGMIRSWLEWMADLPWAVASGGGIEVAKARIILDEDHYDLDEVKARILEYLAVRKLRRERARVADGSAEGAEPAAEAVDSAEGEAGPAPTTPSDEAAREPILCFVGPPGVGKTSLGQSIARALGRKFVRMSLGGVRDEAEIRGHRRTYIGSMPGRIIQGIRRVGVRDPVFMLDEVDKVGADWRGDPTSALLEVLDPAQNDTFVDNYLGVPFDLSQVLFITTANTLDTIPPPLLDRMEVLRIAGYTEEEKLHIAERYLIPQQLAANGLAADELSIDEAAIRRVIREHTREAGVRELDRRIGAICRKVARRVAESAEGAAGHHERIEVRADDIPEYLGRRRFFEEAAERTERPGVATGLAWTPTGGEILFIEAAMVPDEGDQPLLLTGMLGDVMRESAMAAVTYVRSEASRLGIDPGVFSHRRIHVHVPAGALPKDGPSAGVAMATAIASLASGRPVREATAMTGEITLRGKVLPVGGIKEKVLAAHRAGLRTVILPRRNEADLEDVPEEVRTQIRFVLVDDVDRVLGEALGIGPAAATSGSAPSGTGADASTGAASGDGAGSRTGEGVGSTSSKGVSRWSDART